MEIKMSWYRRRPRTKEPEKLRPHHSSPIADRMLEEAKKTKEPTEIKQKAKPK